MKFYLAELRANLSLALPLIAAQLAAVGMGAVDTMFAGHLGPQALAAVAVGANINAVPFVFFMGLFMVASAIVSKRRGREDATLADNIPGFEPAEVGGYARAMLQLAFVCGLVWSLGMWWLAEPLIASLRLSAETQRLAVDYLQYFGCSGFGLSLWFCLRYCAEGLAASKPVMWVGLMGFALNALLNWLLIYGVGPLPALGVKGSGLATAIAALSMPLALAACYWKLPRLAAARLFARGTEAGAVRQSLKLGLPIACTLLAEAGLFVLVSMLMARMGERVMAAHQIAINISSIVFMIPVGLGLATTVRVAYFRGAGELVAARRAGFTGIGLGVGNALLNATVMVVAGGLIVRAYTGDAGIAAQAVGFLLLAAVFQVFDGVQVTASGALRGLHDTRTPMLITLAAYWLVGLPVAWWLAFEAGFGPPGLWWGLTAGLAAAALGLTLRFSLTRN